MAQSRTQYPIDCEGICMKCKTNPSEGEIITCKICIAPWHVNCFSTPLVTLSSTIAWECPDCSSITEDPITEDPIQENVQSALSAVPSSSSELVAAMRAIEADESLTEQEKARKRQNLMTGDTDSPDQDEEDKSGMNDVLAVLGNKLLCCFCMLLPERPLTTPCGHNCCLKCFQKWIKRGKKTCGSCRLVLPPKMLSNPRINSSLVAAIRLAKANKSVGPKGPDNVLHYRQNADRPDTAFTTERAKKSGKANACSGRIFVTVAADHFGPILAENDPDRNRGVLVGDFWEDRMECRQWGAHRPHVAGIAGQSDYGAQSVALSGGYEDDEDHGEWFLYTGSGGRDLSGNKRTNKDQSKDQVFEKMNEALRLSCKKGYPVRVVRSHKEKRSSYAPETGVRYDGVYRIEKCWRKVGVQGFKVCRYLFVRCDNEPAPWTIRERGDRPSPLPVIDELNDATDITERKGTPSWDFDEENSVWKWMKPPPASRAPIETGDKGENMKVRKAIRQAKSTSVHEKLLKEFKCGLCRKVMSLPLTTPCAHNFCKPCLEGAFAGKAFVRERSCQGRTLRAQKTVMKCPSCPNDISDFVKDPQVNRELMGIIESLQSKIEENKPEAEDMESSEVEGENSNPNSTDDAANGGDAEITTTENAAEAEPNPAKKQKISVDDSAPIAAAAVAEIEVEGNDSSATPLVQSEDSF